jgi:hypothetical protein
MTARPPGSFKALLLATLHGRLIGALIIISLVLGIAIEGVQFASSLIGLEKLQYDRDTSRVESRAKNQPAPDMTGRGAMNPISKQQTVNPSPQEQVSLIKDPSTRTIIYFAIWGLIFLFIGWGTTRHPLLNAPIGTAAFFAVLAFVKYGLAPDVLYNAAFAFVLSLSGRLLGRAIYPFSL